MSRTGSQAVNALRDSGEATEPYMQRASDLFPVFLAPLKATSLRNRS